MKVPARLSTLFVSAVSQSMSVDLMEKVARTVIPDYDVHERSGFPSNIMRMLRPLYSRAVRAGTSSWET